MKFLLTLAIVACSAITFSQIFSATDNVVITGTNTSGFNNNSRGFVFIPNTNITLTELGHRLPGQNGTYTWVIWENATQTIVHSQVSTLPNNPGVYQYEPISSPVSLTAGVTYTLSLYHAGSTSTPYYFGTSTQINSNLTYVTMRYCNSCNATQYPTNTLANYHYGTPDFHFVICTAPTTSTTVLTQCDSLVSPSGNYTWTSSGLYYDTIANSQGCDSLMTFDLTITNSTSNVLNESACGSYTSPGGNTYTSSGVYYDTLQNSIGCDSLITINLSISNDTSSAITENACDSYVSPGGQNLTSTGTYYDTLTTVAGCDSIVTINLTINQSTSSTQNDSVVDTYTWPVNGQTYTSTGVYTDTLTNAAGCDSIVTLVLFVQHTGIDESGFAALTVYPNPASSYVMIIVPEQLIGTSYEIVDNAGKTLINGTLSSEEVKIDIDQFANGIYILQFNDSQKQNFRIFKE